VTSSVLLGEVPQHGGTPVRFLELPGSGTPILLVHGVGASLTSWEDIPFRLNAAGRHVLAADLLGHGSSGSLGEYTLAANASMLRQLLDHLGIARVHLVGHSLGGGVAMQFASQEPARVSSLTLISSGGLGTDISYSMRAAVLPGAAPVIRIITHRAITKPMRRIVEWLAARGVRSRDFNQRSVETLESLQHAGRLAAFVGTLRSVIGLRGQRVTVLDRLDILDPERLLVIWGARDPMLPVQHGIAIQDLLPDTRLVVLAESGHEPHADEPDSIIDEILAHTEEGLPQWSPPFEP